MWSLPDIRRLNEEAVAVAQSERSYEAQARDLVDGDGDPAMCEFCYHNEEPTEAVYGTVYYDPFSDDPKGVIFECYMCRENGYYSEHYFECDDCGRMHVLNYTWELYRASSEDGAELCIPCYAKRCIEDESRWLRLTPEVIDGLNFEQVRSAPHIRVVSGPVPEGLEHFESSVCLDSSSGGRVTGFSSSESTPDGGVRELQKLLRKAADEGHERAMLVCDAGWQFAVDIGVYVDA
jgi:hypothetical protein